LHRRESRPRENWQERVERVGLLYRTTPAGKYWDESAYYELSTREIEMLERATVDVHAMALEAAQHVIDRKRYDDLKIPKHAVPLIERSWRDEPPSIYGRFDFSFDGTREPKLLEYNADAPPALLEAGGGPLSPARRSCGRRRRRRSERTRGRCRSCGASLSPIARHS